MILLVSGEALPLNVLIDLAVYQLDTTSGAPLSISYNSRKTNEIMKIMLTI